MSWRFVRNKRTLYNIMLISDVGEHDFLTYFSHILQSHAFFIAFYCTRRAEFEI